MIEALVHIKNRDANRYFNDAESEQNKTKAVTVLRLAIVRRALTFRY